MRHPRLTFGLGLLAGIILLLVLQSLLEGYANRRGWTRCDDGTYRAIENSPVRLRPHSWFSPLPRLEVRD